MWFFKKTRQRRKTAAKLYASVVGMARNPWLYTDAGVPDTLDGRFDSVALHLALLMRRLKSEGDEGLAICSELSSVFVTDMDQSVREIGVGDMSVGRHVKNMTQALYGRMKAYEAALGSDDVLSAMKDALARNVFRGELPAGYDISPLADYVLKQNKIIVNTSKERVMNGDLS